ncbi:hypothetical protein ABR737_01465 [Streptomyces sp. Edi2]|uniref:hypothetical protein n=1 Tax=Streptomyces sp. Edi2 TaxID=3162528 RepID=UPI0033058D14
MSVHTESRLFRPAAHRAVPLLRFATLALTLPAMLSDVTPLLVVAFVGVMGLGLWMLAFAIYPDGRSRGRSVASKLTALALLMDGLAFLTVAGLILGVLINGSLVATLITLPGLAAVGVFAVLRIIHRKIYRAVRRARW